VDGRKYGTSKDRERTVVRKTLPSVGTAQASYAFDGSCFAGSVRSEQSEYFTFVHHE
jgi:hypothetical protein